MPDHAVGGVDGLVRGDAGQAEQTPEQAGATTASEAFSARLSIAARVDAALVELFGIAADDVAYRSAPTIEARFEPGIDGADVAGEVELRQKEVASTASSIQPHA